MVVAEMETWFLTVGRLGPVKIGRLIAPVTFTCNSTIWTHRLNPIPHLALSCPTLLREHNSL